MRQSKDFPEDPELQNPVVLTRHLSEVHELFSDGKIIFCFLNFIDVLLSYNVVFISAVRQSDSVKQIYILFHIFSIMAYAGC